MSKIWQWIASAAAAVMGLLWVWLQIVSGQRDRARDEANAQRERADTTQARRETERRIGEAQQQAREAAREAAGNEDNRRTTGDRSGGLDNRRLRD